MPIKIRPGQGRVSCSHAGGALFGCQASNTVAVCAMVLLSCLQKSMSGIELDETCVNLFMHMKTRSSVSSRGLREYTVPAKQAVPGWRAEVVCSTVVYMHHQQACLVLAVAAASIWYRLFELTARLAVPSKACLACFPCIHGRVVYVCVFLQFKWLIFKVDSSGKRVRVLNLRWAAHSCLTCNPAASTSSRHVCKGQPAHQHDGMHPRSNASCTLARSMAPARCMAPKDAVQCRTVLRLWLCVHAGGAGQDW